jgi:hypothetical protein
MSWGTVVYGVAQISYAQCGIYNQFVKRRVFDLKFPKTPFRGGHGPSPLYWPSGVARQWACRKFGGLPS